MSSTESSGGPSLEPGNEGAARDARVDRGATDREQALSDRDQTASDQDQSASDDDQTGSESDSAASARDQHSSDQDQAAADRDSARGDEHHPSGHEAHEESRRERKQATEDRAAAERDRSGTTEDRARTASRRDETAEARDDAARLRDATAERMEAEIISSHDPLARRLEQLRAQAAADRAQAALDRRRAARDRAQAAVERAQLDAELATAHLDGLTGAYRREMGDLMLSNEIARARRAGGQFVVAYVDVDRLKKINDRDGHAAGDHVLKTVVQSLRSSLRSFDPIVRYGGDEFVCGLGTIGTEEAERRFDAVRKALQEESITISVGLASLQVDETREQLVARADAALLEAKQKPLH